MKLLGLREDNPVLSEIIYPHLSKRDQVPWNIRTRKIRKHAQDQILQALCQKSIIDYDPWPYARYPKEDRRARWSDDLAKKEDLAHDQRCQLDGIVLGFFADCLSNGNQLFRDLIYCGNTNVWEYLLAQLARQGKIGLIDAWASSSKDCAKLWRDRFWRTIIRSGLQANQLEMLQEILFHAGKLKDGYRKINEINLLWDAIEVGTPEAVEIVHQHASTSLSVEGYVFTGEQIDQIVALDQPRIYEIVLEYDCTQMSTTVPVGLVAKYYRLLVQRYRALPDQSRSELLDTKGYHLRHLAGFLARQLNEEPSRSEQILQIVSISGDIGQEALFASYQKSLVLSMRVLCRVMKIAPAELLLLLSLYSPDRMTSKDRMVRMLQGLEIDLTDQDCFLFRNNGMWTKKIRSAIKICYRPGPVRYYRKCIISDYQIGFGSEYVVVIPGVLDCKFYLYELGSGSDSEDFNRAGCGAKLRALLAKSESKADILEVRIHGWYVYRRLAQCSDPRCLIQLPDSEDPERYLPRKMISFLADLALNKTRTKSARSAMV